MPVDIGIITQECYIVQCECCEKNNIAAQIYLSKEGAENAAKHFSHVGPGIHEALIYPAIAAAIKKEGVRLKK